MVEIIEKLVTHDDWLRCRFACGQVEVWKTAEVQQGKAIRKSRG